MAADRPGIAGVALPGSPWNAASGRSPDLRGHGESGWAPDAAYAIDDYAADARAVIAQVGAPVAIVGASLGGLTGLVVAGESDPPLVSALILVDVTPGSRMKAAPRSRAS